MELIEKSLAESVSGNFFDMTTKSQLKKKNNVKLDFMIFKNCFLEDVVEEMKTQATDKQ